MTIIYHPEVDQGSDDWHALRCGLLTASTMARIITPSLKVANNDKSRAYEWELLAQRITRYVEPQFVTDAMLRGQVDEITARQKYSAEYAKVTETGFVTNDAWGFTIGYSPDGLVGDDGLIEVKSRYQRFQVETIINGAMPDDYMMQVQTGLLVTGRKWCDFISYSGGLPMVTIRIEPDAEVQGAILQAAAAFEARLSERLEAYAAALASGARLIETERDIEQEISFD